MITASLGVLSLLGLFGNVLCSDSLNNGTKDYSCGELTNEYDCLNIPPFHSENDLFSQVLNFNYTCMWNGTNCQRVICSHINDESDCNSYNNNEYNYLCDWALLPHNNESICYNNCQKKYQIVLAVDTSASVIDPNQGGNVNNSQKVLNSVINIISYVWSLAQIQNGDLNDGIDDIVKISLITYSSDVSVHFDLNNEISTLDEYITIITDIFGNMTYLDDTATAPAMETAYDIFNEFEDSYHSNDSSNNSGNDNNNNWNKIFGIITHGQGNIPPTAASPCSNNGEIYEFNEKFSELNVLFHSLMVTIDDKASFECLTEAPLFGTIEYFESFDDINDEIGLLFETQVCNNNDDNIITYDNEEDYDNDNENDPSNNNRNLLIWIVAAVVGTLLLALFLAAAFAKARKIKKEQPKPVNDESNQMISK